MTGSPKIQDFKSCIPRVFLSSCSSPQEALGTRMNSLYANIYPPPSPSTLSHPPLPPPPSPPLPATPRPCYVRGNSKAFISFDTSTECTLSLICISKSYHLTVSGAVYLMKEFYSYRFTVCR